MIIIRTILLQFIDSQIKYYHYISDTKLNMIINSTINHKVPENKQVQINNYIYNPNFILGTGNFSKVCPAKNIITGQNVALKIIELSSLNDRKLMELHKIQIDILMKLNHPNVLKCYQIIHLQHQCILVTEICQEGDLNMLLKKQGVLSEQKISWILKDILEGLNYLSSLNIIHRDLKPANILMSKGRAVIADFGLAAYAKHNFKDMNIGSPLSMSPEGFIDCIYGPKTDVWAFGILIFQLLHGDNPYSSCKLDKDLCYHLSLPFNKIKIKPMLRMDLKELICLCLEVNQSKRISIPQLRQTNYFKRIYYELSHAKVSYPPNKRLENSVQINSPTLSTSTNDTNINYRLNEQPILNPRYTIQEITSPRKQIIHEKKQISRLIMSPQNNQRYSPIKLAKQNSSPKKMLNSVSFLNPNSPKQQNFKDVIRLGRPISSEKFMNRLKFQKDQLIKKRIKSIDTNKKPQQKYIIFTLPINLKITINLMHYSRCLYKSIQIINDFDNQKQYQNLKFMTGWLMIILEEINKKINNNQIIFQGQNVEAQSKKLREVRNQYQRRYVNTLKPYMKNSINKPSLQQVKIFFCERYLYFDRLIKEQKSLELIQLGHLIIILYDATRLIIKCQEQHNYGRFLNYKHIQNVLGWQVQQFTFNSYLNFKKIMVNS